MVKVIRCVLVAALMAGGSSWALQAHADVSSGSAANVQEGDNKSSTDQDGTSASGDAVAGQVTGVVAAGNTSVDATNLSDNVDATTGDARSDNTTDEFVGLDLNLDGSFAALTADIFSGSAVNVQQGDNKANLNQTADAESGDTVLGQVIGVVTSPGGSADLVLANISVDSDGATGDARLSNDNGTVVGQNATTPPEGVCPLPTGFGALATPFLSTADC